MSNPKQAISRGLDQREAERNIAAPNRLAVLQTAPSNINSLKQLAGRAVRARDRMAVLATAITSDLERFRETKVAELANLGKINTDQGFVDQLGESRRQVLLDQAMRERGGIARGTSETERITLRRDLLAIKEVTAAVQDTFSDPVGLLYNRTIDSGRRDTIASNLSRQGPRACHDAMKRALATGDAELAAAALDRFDKLSDDERDLINISKREFATALVADEFTTASRLLITLDIATDEGELLNMEAEGRDVSRQRIGLGLKRKQLDELPPAPTEDAGTKTYMRGPKTESVKDPTARMNEIHESNLKAGDEIIAAALRGEYAPDAGGSADA